MKVFEVEIASEHACGMTAYLHTLNPEVPGREVRPAVILCPGGGYRFLSQREDETPAMAFLAAGYQVFVLHYSVRDEKTGPEEPLGFAPLTQLSHAVTLLRTRAEEWHIAADRIAVCGFSAGAHVAGSLGILWNRPELAERLGNPNGSNRPDAMILCYPVVSSGAYAHRDSFLALAGDGRETALRELLSLEQQVDSGASPAFLWHTQEDDTVPVENTLLLAAALQKNHVPMECHIFTHGIHGQSLCTEECGCPDPHCAAWFPLCLDWLAGLFCWQG